jgi:hypothetical protein
LFLSIFTRIPSDLTDLISVKEIRARSSAPTHGGTATTSPASNASRATKARLDLRDEH